MALLKIRVDVTLTVEAPTFAVPDRNKLAASFQRPEPVLADPERLHGFLRRQQARAGLYQGGYIP